MKSFMKVYWIEYPDNKQLIDNDEDTLIKGLRPLLNIKKNDNAKKDALNNPTRTYKLRRNFVETTTKSRLGFKK
jgi:hypothetical protein